VRGPYWFITIRVLNKVKGEIFVMDRAETLKILSLIDAAYPRFYNAKDQNRAKTLVIIWCKMFINNDYHLVGSALKAHIATSPFPPTVADIKQIIDKLVNPQITELEAWNIVSRAIGKTDLVKQYGELPEEIKGFMSYKDFKSLSRDNTPEGVISSNWQRSFKAYQERRKFDRIAGFKSGSDKLMRQNNVRQMADKANDATQIMEALIESGNSAAIDSSK
jgi:hypothetical protein